MADDAEKQTDSAEKAYAAASAGVPLQAEPAAPAPVAKTVAADKPVAAEAPKATKPAAPKPAKPVRVKAAKAARTAQPARTSKPAKRAKPAAKPNTPPKISAPVAAKAPPASRPTQPTITELKEKIMASAKTPEFSKSITDTVSDMQSRAKDAFDKSSELAGEMTEFAKGNVEAMVESSKIFAAGVQELGKSYAAEAKSAYETATSDMKEMAAIKSPTELFQLQGKLLRRNFDAMVAYGSKNTEAVVKLANDSFAPLSSRVSLAAEKIAKVA